MTILFAQHEDNKAPRIFKDPLYVMGISSHILENFSQKNFSLHSDFTKGYYILGSSWMVDTESKYPFLKEEKKFIGNLFNK